jgi:hypothetical protein
MMKQKRSMDDAIEAAKRMRQQLVSATVETREPPDTRLKVVSSSASEQSLPPPNADSGPASVNGGITTRTTSPLTISNRPTWVRHTIGLRETTSLRLRDAAEAQKRKARYGMLAEDEPSNEQEIADLGIQLALQQLGFAE